MDVELTCRQEAALATLLVRHGADDPGQWQRQWLAGDGSDRRFCRLCGDGTPSLMAALPGDHPKALAEARAGFAIGRHLAGRGVPVPACHDFDPATGILLCEDLGDRLLHTALADQDEAGRRALYHEAIVALVRLQLEGRQGFVPSWCWDTPRYDRWLMVSREAWYFRDAFCRGLLGFTDLPAGLDEEFRALAARASAAPADFLLHRDFQSRNLMLTPTGIRIIDFQGARLGPLGYDLASLLVDPYSGLDEACQAELLEFYLATVNRYITLDPHSFYEGYYYLFLQRNLQILGAFANLSQNRGKTFFRSFLAPALSSLAQHLGRRPGDAFPCLRALVDASRSRLEPTS